MICLAISYCSKKEKTPHILTFKFRYFPIFSCKGDQHSLKKGQDPQALLNLKIASFWFHK